MIDDKVFAVENDGEDFIIKIILTEKKLIKWPLINGNIWKVASKFRTAAKTEQSIQNFGETVWTNIQVGELKLLLW